jgi:transketolase
VLYPCDGVSAERLVALAAYHPGPVYIRTSRPKTSVLYSIDETFAVGGLKVLRESGADVATVVAAGVTVFEALKACDELGSAGTSVRVIDLYSVAPVDGRALIAAGTATGGRIVTVEDHYAAGGSNAVAEAVSDAIESIGSPCAKFPQRQTRGCSTATAFLPVTSSRRCERSWRAKPSTRQPEI